MRVCKVIGRLRRDKPSRPCEYARFVGLFRSAARPKGVSALVPAVAFSGRHPTCLRPCRSAIISPDGGPNPAGFRSEDAKGCFKKKGCSVDLHPTPEGIQVWNEAEGKGIGVFHVTC
jgi:hypothetical protein